MWSSSTRGMRKGVFERGGGRRWGRRRCGWFCVLGGVGTGRGGGHGYSAWR